MEAYNDDDYEYIPTSDGEYQQEEEDDTSKKGAKVAFYSTMVQDFADGKYFKKQYKDHLQCAPGLNIFWDHAGYPDCDFDNQYLENGGKVERRGNNNNEKFPAYEYFNGRFSKDVVCKQCYNENEDEMMMFVDLLVASCKYEIYEENKKILQGKTKEGEVHSILKILKAKEKKAKNIRHLQIVVIDK